MNFTAAERARRAGLLSPTEQSRRFFNVPQISELLRTCDRTVTRWLGRKELIAHHFGGATRIGSDDLIDFIARARRGPVPLQPFNPLEQKFYIVDEVADLLKVCVRTVRRHIESERLAHHKFGRLQRISGRDLQDYIARSRHDEAVISSPKLSLRVSAL